MGQLYILIVYEIETKIKKVFTGRFKEYPNAETLHNFETNGFVLNLATQKIIISSEEQLVDTLILNRGSSSGIRDYY